MAKPEHFWIVAGYQYEKGEIKGSWINEMLAQEEPQHRDEAKRLIEIGRKEAR
jgi:hypothetical protein